MASEDDAVNNRRGAFNPNMAPHQHRDDQRNYYITGKIMANRIFVGGFDQLVTEEDLCGIFSQHGRVKGAKIVMGPSGTSKGYGFVTFENSKDVDRILQNDNIIFGQKKLTIGHAFHKPTSQVKYIPYSVNPAPGARRGQPQNALPAFHSTYQRGGPQGSSNNMNYWSLPRPPTCYTHQQFAPIPYQWRVEPQIPIPTMMYMEPPYYTSMPAYHHLAQPVRFVENTAESSGPNVGTGPSVAPEN